MNGCTATRRVLQPTTEDKCTTWKYRPRILMQGVIYLGLCHGSNLRSAVMFWTTAMNPKRSTPFSRHPKQLAINKHVEDYSPSSGEWQPAPNYIVKLVLFWFVLWHPLTFPPSPTCTLTAAWMPKCLASLSRSWAASACGETEVWAYSSLRDNLQDNYIII